MIDHERWARLDELLDRALERPAGERRSFLHAECGADEALRAEALRLLDLAETDDGELRPGALTAGPWDETLDGEAAALAQLPPGSEVGPYRVLGLLGRGGMGYVYEAEDPKLGRHVALKVLPAELDTEERRRRFEREARTLAAIQHPGIVHVYSIEESKGVRYIAMERVYGRTLGEKIGEQGLPLDELIDVAIPLTDALAAAHARGVIHRDLKPANVMVTDDGHVKVLDFGVAKRSGTDESAASRAGIVVGTVAYMSPEQAEGREVDQRTDLFALGILLFRMSTGELPFRGGSAASVIQSLLHDTPPTVTDLQPRLPSGLSRIVRRCLAKDKQRRYQTALEVKADLEELRRELAPDSGGVRAARARRRVAIGAAAGIGLVAAVAALLRLESSTVLPLEGTFAPATSEPGPEFFPSLSPDGRRLAYAGRDHGHWDVYLRGAAGESARNLTADWKGDDVQPTFSADGGRLAFRSSRAGGGLYVMDAAGGEARRVIDRGWNPSWSPDGREIAFATQPVFDSPYDRPASSELWAVNVADGRARRVTAQDALQPAWSPHGHRLAYWGLVKGSARRDLWTVPAGGGAAVPVTQDEAVDWSPAWSPDGRYLYFSSDRGGSMNLWRIALDERSGRVRGQPERVTTPAAFAHHASFAREAGTLAYVSTSVEQELQKVAFDPLAARPVGEPQPLARDLRRPSFPEISRDGKWLVYSQAEPQEDLLVSRLDGSERRMLTNDAHRDRRPRFSPDGQRIAFYSDRSGNYEVWTVARDGSDLRQHSRDPQRRNARHPTWSPDGSRLFFSRTGTTGEIIAVDRELDAPPLLTLPPYVDPAYSFAGVDWSPDGGRIAGTLVSGSGERVGIAVYDLGLGRFTQLTDFGMFPKWMSDSRRLVFAGPSPSDRAADRDYPRGESLFVVDSVTRQVAEVLSQPEAGLGYPSLSPDDGWLVYVRTLVKADVWTLTSAQ